MILLKLKVLFSAAFYFPPPLPPECIDVMREIESLKMMFYYVGHHPDLHLVGWNNVTIEIWTHSVGMNMI